MRNRIAAIVAVLLAATVLTPVAAGAVGGGGNGSSERTSGVVERSITFENDGTVVGTLSMPTRTRHAVPMVLILHGFTGTRDELPIIGTDEFTFARTARLFGEAGIATLRIDFRGSGESDGTFDQTTFTSQISDALAALDVIDRMRKVDDDRIGVLGLSQGGLVASAVAAVDDRVDSVVLWSPVANPVDTYKGILGADAVLDGLGQPTTHIVLPWGAEIDLQQSFFEDLYTVDPIAEISHYDGPLQVVVGLRDTLVTPQPYYGKTYTSNHTGSNELIELDGDHVFDVLSGDGPGVIDEAIAHGISWFDTTMP